MKGRKKTFKKESKTINKMAIRTFILIIILNVNGLSAATKRHRLAEWIKNKTRIYAVYKRLTSDLRDTYRLKLRGWRKVFYTNGNQKKAGVAILISEKTDFKINNVTRDKEGHYIMIKGSIQEDIAIINIYAPNIGAPQYIR